MEEQKSVEHLQEEVLEGDWTRPSIDLKEVAINTGEEDEDVMWKCRSKLYRWSQKEWKERGIGDAKLLRHNKTNKIRFLLRQEKTLKVVANHYVLKRDTLCKLIPHVSNDKIWVWSVYDYAEDEPRVEQFALKFKNVAAATEFKEKFEEAATLNSEVFKDSLPESANKKSETDASESATGNKITEKSTKELSVQEETVKEEDNCKKDEAKKQVVEKVDAPTELKEPKQE